MNWISSWIVSSVDQFVAPSSIRSVRGPFIGQDSECLIHQSSSMFHKFATHFPPTQNSFPRQRAPHFRKQASSWLIYQSSIRHPCPLRDQVLKSVLISDESSNHDSFRMSHFLQYKRAIHFLTNKPLIRKYTSLWRIKLDAILTPASALIKGINSWLNSKIQPRVRISHVQHKRAECRNPWRLE